MNQQGGRILVQGAVGARAGLRQSGGDLIVAGSVGPLAGERRTGGRFLARPERIGPHFGRGASGGRFQPLPPDPSRLDASTPPPLSDLLSEHDDRFDWIDSL
jgi:glutamate synthase domain-containing protein 3